MPSLPSIQTAASSEAPDTVVDTVVLRYFLLVDGADLLLELLGGRIGTPRIVYDPDEEPTLPEDVRSEVTRSISYQRRAAADPTRDGDARRDAVRNAKRLEQVEGLHASGKLVILDLTDEELPAVGRLTSPSGCRQFGLRFPLDAGEAACLAVAVGRGLVLATDDADALRALDHLARSHPYERIRKLLLRAGNGGFCTREAANEIHREMRRLGFWDRDEPFPAGS